MRKVLPTRIFVWLLWLPILFGTLANVVRAQSAREGVAREVLSEAKPTNLWQQDAKTPQPLPASGTKDYENRMKRNAYAEKAFGPHMPIEELEARHWAASIDHLAPLPTGSPAVPPSHPNELVAEGSFDSYDVVLTPSHMSIYTEVNVTLASVQFCNFPTCPGPNSHITIFEPGGTVSLANRSRLSIYTDPRPWGLTPTHRYVLFLKRLPEGDFYLLDKSIDITDGTATPNSPDDAIAARNGTWPFHQADEWSVKDEISRKLNSYKGNQK